MEVILMTNPAIGAPTNLQQTKIMTQLGEVTPDNFTRKTEVTLPGILDEITSLQLSLATLSGALTATTIVANDAATTADDAAEDAATALARVATIQADSVATEVAELVTDFNALIDKLQAAGLMANA
jgi:hypothetical protein